MHLRITSSLVTYMQEPNCRDGRVHMSKEMNPKLSNKASVTSKENCDGGLLP